jgi:putative Ca2+/H+ antiporter (TMEM165/GDT1 family)
LQRSGHALVFDEANMDFKLFATVFSTIFVAELGDKTQLATLLYASDASHPKLTVFAASAAALVLTSALGVLAGSFVAEHVNPKLIRWAAGLGFIAVGAWVLLSHE